MPEDEFVSRFHLHMHNTAVMVIEQRIRTAEADAARATSSVRQARTLQEATQAALVHLPAELRGLRSQIRGLTALRLVAERRLTELLRAQLDEVAKLPLEQARKRLASLQMSEWQVLRGEWASVYRWAERESSFLLGKLTAGEKSVGQNS